MIAHAKVLNRRARIIAGMVACMALSVPPAHADELSVTSAVEFPQPLTLGLQYKTDAHPEWVAFYEVGFFQYSFSGGGRSISTYSMETGVRYHPFLNGFYVGSQLGFRKIGLQVDISNLKQDGVSMADTATASLGTLYAGLFSGYEWRLGKGFGIAFDAGLQLALLHAGGIRIEADPSLGDGTDLSVSDRKQMDRISGLPLPQIAILRLIWYL
ncbi:DUF3575 domain-containing protein [bacterium]|jgi:hypothetical protein|nr:DUF3575 domain-containing protein [bacterium]